MLPRHYSIVITPDLACGTFSGRVTLDLARLTGDRRILLDIAGLCVTRATIAGQDARFALAGERLEVFTDANMVVDAAEVEILFSGNIVQTAPGLVRTGAGVLTQLQPVRARHLFPCVDDLSHKATFDLTLEIGLGLVVAAGSHVESEEFSSDGKRRLRFARTSPMPAHLLGFAIGDFSVTNAVSHDIPVRFFARQANGREQFALEAARRAISFFVEGLGCAYPFDGLDLVAVPELEAAGVESTGIIAFREAAVLIDPDDQDGELRRRIASLVSHEVAHQWFGSLVTPGSWEDLWLSEGFATWASSRAVAHWRGEDAARIDGVRNARAAMAADSLSSAPPLRRSIAHGDDPRSLYDTLTYRKGGAILSMLEKWMGAEAFDEGVRQYIVRHAGGTATSSDLWDALASGSALPVRDVAASFTEQPGVPLVSFRANGTRIEVARSGAGPSAVPIFVRAGLADGSEFSKTLLLRDTATLQTGAAIAWIVGNDGGAGYYRCTYAELEFPSGELREVEAFVLAADAWDAFCNGELSVVAYLAIVEGLARRTASGDAVRAHLADLSDLLAGGARAAQFEAWIAARVPDLKWPTSAHEIESLDQLIAREGNAANESVMATIENRLACRQTRVETWKWIESNWHTLRVNAVSFGTPRIIAALASFSDPLLREAVARTFEADDSPEIRRAVAATLETIDARIRFRESNQLAFDAWLARQSSPTIPLTPALRFSHTFASALYAGFHGALLFRRQLDRRGAKAAEWMQPPEALRETLVALAKRMTAVIAGIPVIDPAILQLAARLREDLMASACVAEEGLDHLRRDAGRGTHVVRALLARHHATQDLLLRSGLVLAELFNDAQGTAQLRAALRAAAADRSAQNHFERQRESEPDLAAFDVWNEAAALPGAFRLFAIDLVALEARLSDRGMIDYDGLSWQAYGFTADSAIAWREAGFGHPAAAGAWASRQFDVLAARRLAAQGAEPRQARAADPLF